MVPLIQQHCEAARNLYIGYAYGLKKQSHNWQMGSVALLFDFAKLRQEGKNLKQPVIAITVRQAMAYIAHNFTTLVVALGLLRP